MSTSRMIVIVIAFLVVFIAQTVFNENAVLRIALTIVGVAIATSSAAIAQKLTDTKGKN